MNADFESPETLLSTMQTTDSYLEYVGKKQKTENSTRKTPAKISNDLDKLVKLYQAGHPDLVIQAVLGITPSEYEKMVGKAAMKKGFQASTRTYQAIKASALGEEVLKLLAVIPNTILRIQVENDGLIVTPIRKEEVAVQDTESSC